MLTPTPASSTAPLFPPHLNPYPWIFFAPGSSHSSSSPKHKRPFRHATHWYVQTCTWSRRLHDRDTRHNPNPIPLYHILCWRCSLKISRPFLQPTQAAPFLTLAAAHPTLDTPLISTLITSLSEHPHIHPNTLACYYNQQLRILDSGFSLPVPPPPTKSTPHLSLHTYTFSTVTAYPTRQHLDLHSSSLLLMLTMHCFIYADTNKRAKTNKLTLTSLTLPPLYTPSRTSFFFFFLRPTEINSSESIIKHLITTSISTHIAWKSYALLTYKFLPISTELSLYIRREAGQGCLQDLWCVRCEVDVAQVFFSLEGAGKKYDIKRL